MSVLSVGLLSSEGCDGGGPVRGSAQPRVDAGRAPVWAAQVPSDAGDLERAQVAGDVIVVQAEKKVLAYGRRAGNLLWSVERRGSFQLVSVSGGVVVLSRSGTSDALVGVVDLRTGAERFSAGELSRVGVTADSLLGVRRDGPSAERVQSYDLRTGRIRWSRRELGFWDVVMPNRAQDAQATMPPRSEPGGVTDPLLASGARRLLVRPLKRHRERSESLVQVLDTRTSRVVAKWRSSEELCGQLTDDSGYLRRNTSLIDPTSSCPEGEISAVDLATGRRSWAVSGVVNAVTGEGARSPTVVTGRTVLVMNAEGRPQSIERNGGRIRWRGQPGHLILGLNDQVVVVRDGQGTGDLIGLNATSGAKRWTRRLDGPLTGRLGKGQRDPYWMERHAIVGNRLVYSGRSQRLPPQGSGPLANARLGAVVTVVDLATGSEIWTARRDAGLLGAGPGWVITGRSGQETGEKGPPDIQLYAL
ncbi:PQQ-binding-like beta-propeller repeat protein [Actinomadura sp. 6N118]|uniref:outer membrane protein assembly factor BamB family protein n=1 Tax=Actinomadura sp. 6N118 TaxID=3375151 RepID=UPI00379D7BEB